MKRVLLKAGSPVTIHYTEYSRGKGQSVLNSFNIITNLIPRRLFP
jgi:hypothetical protein